MSNLVFPNPAPPNWSFRFPIKKAPQYKTLIQTPASGLGELRIPLMLYPRWHYTLDLSYLKGNFTDPSTALEQIAGFYTAVQGPADDWLLDEKQFDGDGYVPLANFGTGDSTSLSFQLIRQIGQNTNTAGQDIIQDLNGTPQIYVASVLQNVTAYTISSTGIVTFGTPPPIGAALTWNGSFYRRCRFVDELLGELQLDFQNIWSLHKLNFISVILASAEFTSPQTQVLRFADEEVPSGTINGSNKTFTLVNIPNPAASLQLYLRGIQQRQGVGYDYTLSGNVVTFVSAPFSGDVLLAWYRY